MPQSNTFQYGTKQWNGGASLATVYSTDRIVFEGFSLADGTVMLCEELLDSGPPSELVGRNAPKGDGAFLTARYFRSRVIEAAGIVRQSTAAALDAYLDTVRKNLSTQQGALDLTDAAGTVKRFVSTCVNFDELFAGRRGYHVTYCPFRARFECRTPFGKSRSYSNAPLLGMTTNQTQSLVNVGTYKAQPVVTMIFTAASSVTAVSVANSTTGETITYAGSVAASDVLIFDSEKKTVTKNAAAVDYSGAFPSLNAGSNSVTHTITGTSFAADVTSAWKDSYL